MPINVAITTNFMKEVYFYIGGFSARIFEQYVFDNFDWGRFNEGDKVYINEKLIGTFMFSTNSRVYINAATCV